METISFDPLFVSEFEHDGKKHYSVQIYCGDVSEKISELFEIHDNYDNGYGWEGLVKYVIDKECPDIFEYFDFDCEADTFLTYCSNKEKAFQLAALMQNIIADEQKLSQYLKELPEEYKDA